MIEILPNVFAVEVPEGFDTDNDIPEKYMNEALPDGEFKLLFTTKDCTEEQAGELPLANADEGFGYKDYEGKSSGTFYANISLQPLLRSHGLSTDKNYLLLRKTP